MYDFLERVGLIVAFITFIFYVIEFLNIIMC